MELDIGLKITKTKDDGNLTSSHLRLSKDSAGPLFFSTETESMFILTAHLKGYRRERLKIEINEDGTQIAISGEKAIQEMVMVRWTMYKKEVEIKRFKRVFRIPDGVILDKIKARFSEEDTVLSIFMPKLKRGIQGISIEEVKEVVVDDDGEKSEILPNSADEVPERETKDEEAVIHERQLEEPEVQKDEEIEELTEQTSLETPEIIREMEPEENTTQAEEIPEMVIQEPETEIVEPLEISSEPEVIDQPIVLDLPLLEEIQNEPPAQVPEEIENAETETVSPEAEPKQEEEDKCLQDIVEPTEAEQEQVLDQPTEEILDDEEEEFTKEETEEPEEDLEEHEDAVEDTSIQLPEIVEPIKLEPDPGLQPLEMAHQPPPPEPQIDDQVFQREGTHPEQQVEEPELQREEIYPEQQIEEPELQAEEGQPEQQIEEQEPQREEIQPEQQIEEPELQREEIHPEQQIEEQEFQREEISAFVAEVLEENEEKISQASVSSSSSSSDVDEDEEPIDTTRYPINGWNPWQRSPFQFPQFMVGSAFLGFLITLVIHLLKKNKKAKKYGFS